MVISTKGKSLNSLKMTSLSALQNISYLIFGDEIFQAQLVPIIFGKSLSDVLIK